MKRILVFVVLASQSLLAACGESVTTTISPVHHIHGSVAGKSFVMVAKKPRDNRPGWPIYADLIAQGLETKGLRRVTDAGAADFAVSFTYQTDDAKRLSWQEAVYTTIGGDPITLTSSSGELVYGTTPTRTIQTGNVTRSAYYYFRLIDIEIADLVKSREARQPVMAYEARVSSFERYDKSVEVLRPMIKALFVDWPGVNGKEVERDVSLK